MAVPEDDAIREMMEKLVPTVDLETMTTKQFIKLLSKKMGGSDLSQKKQFIKENITDILDKMDDEKDGGEEEESSEEEEEPPKKKQRGGGGGLAAVKEISDTLAEFLGKGKQMARTEVVKCLWEYIREHNLQNPEDRREILLDDRMQAVFGVKKFTMFSMNKYVGAHIHPFKPVVIDPNPKPRKRAAPKKKQQKNAKKKKAGTQAPYRLSEEMAAVCGKDILPRPQVTQALWVYIRKHGLQNPEDKREILCDDKMRLVMGGNAKVTMFSMNKYITPHLVEKLDKTAYKHEEGEKNSDESSNEDDEESESESEGSESDDE